MSEKSSNDLAEDRTDWAEDRTIQANERTFAGWMRTGLAAVGMGVALHAIFGEADDTKLAKVAAIMFILIGIAIFASAYASASALLKRLNSHAAEPKSSTSMAILAGTFSLSSALVGIVLIII